MSRQIVASIISNGSIDCLEACDAWIRSTGRSRDRPPCVPNNIDATLFSEFTLDHIREAASRLLQQPPQQQSFPEVAANSNSVPAPQPSSASPTSSFHSTAVGSPTKTIQTENGSFTQSTSSFSGRSLSPNSSPKSWPSLSINTSASAVSAASERKKRRIKTTVVGSPADQVLPVTSSFSATFHEMDTSKFDPLLDARRGRRQKGDSRGEEKNKSGSSLSIVAGAASNVTSLTTASITITSESKDSESKGDTFSSPVPTKRKISLSSSQNLCTAVPLISEAT